MNIFGAVVIVGLILVFYVVHRFYTSQFEEVESPAATECPRCKSENIVSGLLGGDGFFRRARFSVRSGRLVWSTGVEIARSSCACLHCGVVWSYLDKDMLARVLKNPNESSY